MPPFNVGLGQTGIGDNFARARLLLAKRAGLLPAQQNLPQGPGAATATWHSVSKNLAGNARQAGYPNPMQFLRAGMMAGGRLPRPMPNRMPQTPGVPYSLSSMAQTPMSGSPFQMLNKYLPPQQPGMAPQLSRPQQRRPPAPPI